MSCFLALLRTIPGFRMIEIIFCIISMHTIAPAMDDAEVAQRLSAYDVIWHEPSQNARGSMPLGNGSTAVNAWIDPVGDLVFYIARDDAFCGDIDGPDYGGYCLTKVGKIRCHFEPSPFAKTSEFKQVLHLVDGSMEISGVAGAHLRLWVDACRSVIHVEATTATPSAISVQMESWRQEPTAACPADHVLPSSGKDRIGWCLRSRVTEKMHTYAGFSNKGNVGPLGVTTGATVWGEGLESISPTQLQGAMRHRHDVSILTHTATIATTDEFAAQLNAAADAVTGIDIQTEWADHAAWWRSFWARSFIFLSGPKRAGDVGQGYLLQRFKNACTSRGNFPIKFNGSLFTVDWPENRNRKSATADYRRWGHGYWFQNTRAIYWPMMGCGDFDLMRPLFRMYRSILDTNSAQVRELYGHGGAYFMETQYYWGGLTRVSAEDSGNYTKHYYLPILELSAMMLDYYAYTGDKQFLKETLLPIADSGIAFYSEHFSRGVDRKLLLDPVNAIETYWKVRNPAPDIAGLMRVLDGLLALPAEDTSPEMRGRWLTLRPEVPDLPRGPNHGQQALLSFAPGQEPKVCNGENPELYAIHPFRLFGVGRPELDIAQNTFHLAKHINFRDDGCWRQMCIQVAMLGLRDEARKRTTKHLTNGDPEQRFPAFWARGSDYTPDEDNGGNGMYALQCMLLQETDGKLHLLPAWPSEWDARFRLHAPGNTMVEGDVRGGHLISWSVTPESRRSDVIIHEKYEE